MPVKSNRILLLNVERVFVTLLFCNEASEILLRGCGIVLSIFRMLIWFPL